MIQFTMVTITACHRNSVAGFAKDQLHQEHIFLVDSPFDPKETDTMYRVDICWHCPLRVPSA